MEVLPSPLRGFRKLGWRIFAALGGGGPDLFSGGVLQAAGILQNSTILGVP